MSLVRPATPATPNDDNSTSRKRKVSVYALLTAHTTLSLYCKRHGTRLDSEQDNLRAALTWSASNGQQVEAGLRIAAALWSYWQKRGP